MSTVHVYDAAVVEWLPAGSIAFTANVCEPSESAASVFGEEHAEYPPPSIEHSNVAVPSVDENEKFGVESFEFAPGEELIATGGGVGRR